MDSTHPTNLTHTTHTTHMDLPCRSYCETEPIRYPDAIQLHGALLVLGRSSKIIEAASESCQSWLGLSARRLLGQTLGQVFGPEFEAAVLADLTDSLPPLTSLIPLLYNGRRFAVRSFGNDTGHLVIDMEPCETHDASKSLGSFDLTHRCRRGLEALRLLSTTDEVTQAATALIRKLTGFDQVMIYRFDADWNGLVVAESTAENVASFLGLHFPASDIPAQAREFFKLCRVRLIPDVNDTPSALLASTNPHAIDLGRSALRSVSPLHIEYLQNMGVRATLVLALVLEGRLWGLVSCHHKNAPKYMTPADRDAVAWLCEDIAVLLEVKLSSERRAREHCLALRRRRLTDSVRRFELRQIMQADHNADLLGVMGADGFAWVSDGVVQTTGCAPDTLRILEMHRRYLLRAGTLPVYACHALNRDLGMNDADDGVAGVLFVPVRCTPAVTLVWFRRERHLSIQWAGNPQQAHTANDSGRLSPRKSFALFVQEVRGQSLAWQAEELESAAELQVLVEINALREGEVHFKEAQHIACLGSWEWNLASGNNRWSDQQYRIFGYAPGTVCPSYEVFMGAVHPDDRSKVIQAADNAIHGRASYDIEFRIVRPDGHLRHIHSMGRLECDAHGHPLRMTGTLQDITQRIENQLRLEKLLAEQKTLLNNSLVGIAKAQHRTIIWANTAFETILGYGPGELQGVETRRGYPSEAAWRAFGAAVYPLPSPGQIRRIETEFMRKDGRMIWVDLSGTVLDVATDTTLWCYVDITDRKQNALALEASEHRLTMAQEYGHIAFWELDLMTDQYYLSPTFERLIGVPTGSSREMVHERIHPDDRSKTVALAFDTIHSHQPYQTEFRMNTNDGATIWMLSRGNVQYDADGKPIRFVGINLDITDRKQSALELEASQQRLTMAQEAARAGVYELDMLTGIASLSPEFERIFGFKSGIHVEDAQAVAHPDDLDRFRAEIAAAIERHEPYEVEFRYRRKGSSEIRWAVNRGSAQYDATGKPIKRVGINMDITDRKRKDAERDRLQMIIAELPEFVGMIDMQGRQIYLNKAGIKLLGHPEDIDCSTLKINDMQPHWAARRTLEEAIPTALTQGFWQGETALLHRDGFEIPVLQVVLVHRDKSGHPEYLSTIIHDISQQKAAEKELTQAKEAAEAASRTKSQFLANMSHEIRTPMNGVVGMIDILQLTDLNVDQHRMLNTIVQSSQALLRILNDILDYSKIEAGMLSVERVATSLTEVASSVVLLMQSTASVKSIDLSMWIDPRLPPLVLSDPTRLRQVLLNLLGNAVKFTSGSTDHPGCVALRIELGAHPDGTPVMLLRIIDNGMGMSHEIVAKLFQPFTQADASTARQFGGTGLGLSISQRLVTLMGGQIAVTSALGQGAEFTITLPLQEASPDSVVASAPERRMQIRQQVPSIGAALAAHQLVLLAEDNETNSDVLREQLRLLGYASEVAMDGPTALHMWRTGRYALLLTDCHMPGMDGFELTAAIRRAEPAGSRLIIIAVTASAMQGEAKRCLDCGMDDYLSKPVRLQELGNMLAKWLPLASEVQVSADITVADPVPVPMMPIMPMMPMMPKTPMTPEAAQPVVWDANALGQLVGNNPGLHKRLLGKFLHTTQNQVSVIEAAAQAGQMPDAARVAHTLKSAARMVGAMALGELCQHIEMAGLAGDAVSCSALSAGLAQAFAEAQAPIRSHLTSLSTPIGHPSAQ